MKLKDDFKQLSFNQELESNVFLMAEDDPADAEIFSEMLNTAFDNQYSVVCVDRYEKIKEALAQGTFNALILDMDLPDRSGIENVYQIGKDYPMLPIVVLTGNDDLDLAIDSLQNGAQDYLSKNNVTSEMLARSLHYAKERKQVEKILKDALEDAAYKNIQLEAQAKHDPLTGLANRAYFHDAGTTTLMRAQRRNQMVGLLYFDLNGFKKINDTYGHLAGDEMLKQVSIRLKEVVRDTDFIARIGGDEFIIMTDLLTNKNEIYPLVTRIQEQFSEDFHIGTHRVNMGTSIGVAFYPEAENLDLLIKQADCAMYEAKSHSSMSVCFYSEKIASLYARAQRVESCISHALETNEFEAAFQPIVNTDGIEEIHLESLARWESQVLGKVSPQEFIPIAEMTPAINGITEAIISECSKLVSKLKSETPLSPRISINISAKQLANNHFSRTFLSWLERYELSPESVCVELTERQVVENMASSKAHFNILRSHGIQISLDDFGSGFSSITHLLDLPFDILKLDRKLISFIDENSRNQAIIAGIVEMSHRLGMKVVAEGIERSEEKNVAEELGCDYQQGFLFSKPLAISDCIAFYKTDKTQ